MQRGGLTGGRTRWNRERAQVGIGTLVVFIAMVLVAAIAAGVLLDTAGVLSNRAEATGDQSVQQVSNRLAVVSAYGHVTDETKNSGIKTDEDVMPNESVDTLELTIQRAPGSGTVNLSEATVAWVGPETSTTLVHGEAADHAPGVQNEDEAGTFGLEPRGGRRGGGRTATDAHRVFNTYSVDGGDHVVLGEQDDRITVYVNAALVEAETRDAVTPPFAEPLPAGSEAELHLTTASGATTVYRITVPPSLSGKSFVSV
ncbi:archaellin/type IV pilin N-terminal domain-containing protein [Halorussus halobius]|uniref:archaellin/type IV pilin N-terminal domain-containing protein n=1 Tax=Halorussus halobius TaxID=1710537 RepID=UPI001FCEF6EA|nr:archaellin/type IV pilin N-terminal domain-containing protein [Halorussus halobius]